MKGARAKGIPLGKKKEKKWNPEAQDL